MNFKFLKIAAFLLALVMIFSCVGCSTEKDSSSNDTAATVPSSSADVSSDDISSEDTSSDLSSEDPSSEDPSSGASSSGGGTTKPPKQPTSGLKPPSGSGITPGAETNIAAPDGTVYNRGGSYFDYVTPMDMEDNIFMDSLIYTGYRVDKQRADGLMWQYILSSKKRRDGSSGKYAWLTPKISYDYDGGTSGYETNSAGLPDIDFFSKGDLVCASFVGYVYQNYLPNVVGIDTSKFKRPRDYGWSDVLADGWYEVGKMWVKDGYSEFIPFAQSKSSYGCLKITPAKSIPIGSLIVTTDGNNPSDYASHVSVYAGYKYGYNWVYQVGSDNGPEFSCIERMAFTFPQKLIAIITPPNYVNYAPTLEVTVKDQNGNLVSGAEVSIVRDKECLTKNISLGKTAANGVAKKDYLYYGTATLTVKGNGKNVSQKIDLTAQNNSINKVTVTLK